MVRRRSAPLECAVLRCSVMWCQVWCDEVLEEVGYGLQPHQLLPVSSVVSSAGITGSQQAMFLAQVRHCPGHMLRDWQSWNNTRWVCASAGPAVVDSLPACSGCPAMSNLAGAH
jgi:hypothetical protein